MASLLRDLGSAETADDLQAALLAFLPRHMLEDAEGGGGGAAGTAGGGSSASSPLPSAAAANKQQQQQQQPPLPSADAVSALGAASLPRALELMLRRPPDEQLLDSFALRHLVLTRPRALQPLSAFSASASRYVQRVAVWGATGERAVLTFTLARRGAGRGARRHAATMPASSSAAAHWFLVRVEGEQGAGAAGGGGGGKRRRRNESGGGEEAHQQGKEEEEDEPAADAAADADTDLPPTGDELAPETVVARQLDALARGDLDAAYELTSPIGRAVAGDRARFAHLLSADARFAPLLRHAGWTTLRRTQSIARSFVEVVSVRRRGGGGGGGGAAAADEAVFAVIASLHPSASAAAAGAGKEGREEKQRAAPGAEERWLVDYFAPIRDKALLAALLHRGGWSGGSDA
jgi:hypothetical protein